MPRVWRVAGAGLCAALAVALVVGAGLPSAGDGAAGPGPGAQAPDVVALTADGWPARLADLRGGPVILNFWATWCAPCAAEMPVLAALYDERQESGLRVVGVNLGESAGAVRAWGERLGLTFPLWLDPTGEAAARFGVRGAPTTFVLDADGRIAGVFYGPVTRPALEAAL